MDPAQPRRFQLLGVPHDSTTAIFCAWVEAVIAEETIPCACPHSSAADRLSLPSWTLRCLGCSNTDRPDSDPGPCASCEAPDSSTSIFWTDEVSHITVTARVCVHCATDGNVPVTPNLPAGPN